MKFFAYGSNLSRKRLLDRIPSVKFGMIASLPAYQIKFHKRSKDGSGKANAFYTGDHNECVWGIIFECSNSDKIELDKIEGLGKGYNEALVQVIGIDGDKHEVKLYVADSSAIDDNLLPYIWYKNYVVIGARENGLPLKYIEYLEKIEAIEDSNKERARKNSI